MKKILTALLFTVSFALTAQSPLPFSASYMCFDRVVPVSTQSVQSGRNIVVKDFDNNGYDDVLATDIAQGKMVIYKNNTNGTFSPINVLNFPGTKFNSVTAGKFDGDNLPDIAASFSDSVVVYKNMGNCTFSPTPSYFALTPNASPSPTYLRAEDLNGDSFDDLLMAARQVSPSVSNGYEIYAFRNTFPSLSVISFSLDYNQKYLATSTVALSNVLNYLDMSVGDVDGDSERDIMITFPAKLDSVIFLKKLPGGTLNYVTMGAHPPSVLLSYKVACHAGELQDLNLDGKADIVVLTAASNGAATIVGFSCILGSNIISGFPTLYQTISVGVNVGNFNIAGLPNDFKLTDINGDGYKDFVAISDTRLIIYFWDPVGTVTNPLGRFNDDAGVPIYIDLTTPQIGADEMAIGNFDSNLLPDIFFKPWRLANPEKVGVIPNFSYSVATQANDLIVCSAKTITMGVSITPTVGVPTHTMNWYYLDPNPPALIGSGAVVSTSVAGNHYPVMSFPFPYTNSSTCTLSINKLDTIFVTSKPGPTITVSSYTQLACAGNNASISASSGTAGSVSFAWVYQGGTVSATPTLTAQVNGFQTYTVIGTEVSSGCTSSLTVYMDNYPSNSYPMSFSKNPICIGDSTQLSLSGAVGSYTWSNNSHSPSIFVKPIVGTDYTVKFVDTTGCVSTKIGHVDIDGPCQIKIFSVVTPNNDNINDVFTIDNIDRFPTNHVTIFNRWGSKVYEGFKYDNITNFWPPKGNDNFTATTYFYVIDLGNGTEKIKGWFELIR